MLFPTLQSNLDKYELLNRIAMHWNKKKQRFARIANLRGTVELILFIKNRIDWQVIINGLEPNILKDQCST